MKTLTKREKILLYIVVYVIIIAVGGFLLCLPALERNTSLKSEYESIETQWLSTKAGIIEYEGLDQKIAEATAAHQEQVDKFYASSTTFTEDVDNLITSLALRYRLKPMSLEVSEVVEETVISYQDHIQQLAKVEKEGEQASETQEEIQPNVKLFNVSLTVSGSIRDLQAMIHEANTLKSLKVGSVTYSNQALATKSMSVSFIVYMI